MSVRSIQRLSASGFVLIATALCLMQSHQVSSTGGSPVAELIDVYRDSEKLILRCRGFNQTLEFKTSPADQKLLVATAYSQSPSEHDIYQSTYERIFGVYKLPLAYCIAFVKSSEPANNFMDGEYGVRSIKELSYVTIPSASNMLTMPGIQPFTYQLESAKQKEAISLLQSTFSRHSFYYSNQFYDVTRNLQSHSIQNAKIRESLGIEDNTVASYPVRESRIYDHYYYCIDLSITTVSYSFIINFLLSFLPQQYRVPLFACFYFIAS